MSPRRSGSSHADVALVGGDAADVVGMIADQIVVEPRQLMLHLQGVLLIHTEDDGLGEAIGGAQKPGERPGDGMGAGADGDDPLEVEQPDDKVLVWLKELLQ